MKVTKLWGFIFVVSLVAVFAYFQFTEEYETSIWTVKSKKARNNPYLAATHFLENRKVVVDSTVDSLDFTNIATSDIVVLTEVDSMLVSQSSIDAAIDWVSKGGYLLVGVNEESGTSSSILDYFEIESDISYSGDYDESYDEDEDDDQLNTAEQMEEANRRIDERIAERDRKLKEAQLDNDTDDLDDSSSTNGSKITEDSSDTIDSVNDDLDDDQLDIINNDQSHEFYKVSLSESEDFIHLAVLDHYVFISNDYYDSEDESYSHSSDDYEYESADDYTDYEQTASPSDGDDYRIVTSISDENGVRILHYKYGDGDFTVLSSVRMWQNDNIGVGDHAYLLSYLIPNESKLHLFYNVSSPPIWQILHQYFYEAIWALLLLLTLWLWWRAIRVQHVIETVEGQRRNFAEHLSSTAKFLLANKQYEPLLTPLKNDIEQQMRVFYPNYLDLGIEAQVNALAERTDINQSILKQWVEYCGGVSSQAAFFSALKIGNAIRKKL